MMRCERVIFPLLIFRGVKIAEDSPRGASFLEAIPFPGRTASGSETTASTFSAIEPMLKNEVKGVSEREKGLIRQKK